jgi:hypothetical protein
MTKKSSAGTHHGVVNNQASAVFHISPERFRSSIVAARSVKSKAPRTRAITPVTTSQIGLKSFQSNAMLLYRMILFVSRTQQPESSLPTLSPQRGEGAA